MIQPTKFDSSKINICTRFISHSEGIMDTVYYRRNILLSFICWSRQVEDYYNMQKQETFHTTIKVDGLKTALHALPVVGVFFVSPCIGGARSVGWHRPVSVGSCAWQRVIVSTLCQVAAAAALSQSPARPPTQGRSLPPTPSSRTPLPIANRYRACWWFHLIRRSKRRGLIFALICG